MAGAEQFDVVFDITKSPGPDIHLLLFGVGIGCLVTLILLLTRRKGWWVGLLFVAVWSVAVGSSTWGSFPLRSAVAEGRCERDEGMVKDYAPEPYEGHADGDLFTVGGRRFEVSNFIATSGYGRSVPYGGIHLNGRYVRICAVDGEIGKLEVRRETWPAELSEVSFVIAHGDMVAFSKQLYGATQATQVRGYRAVWAKDYGLSDFQIAIAGSCAGAAEALTPLIEEAARGLPEGPAMLADYHRTATCRRSPNPPTASWRTPPPVGMYETTDGSVATTTDGSGKVSRAKGWF